MYQFPTYFPSRLEEYQVLEWVEQELFRQKTSIYYPWKAICQLQDYSKILDKKVWKSQFQYFADAANLLKLGLDIIFLISQSGSIGAYHIFRKFLQDKYDKKVRVHPLKNSYEGAHIDTTITLVGFNKKINKYIALIDGTEGTNPTNIPAIFRGKNWRLIQVNKYNKDFAHPDYALVSDHMGLNFFMINSELAVVNDTQHQIKHILEFYGIKVLSLPNKHACQFLGGFHCVTNDMNRDDIHGFGKILQCPRENLSKAELSGLFDPDLLDFLQQKADIQDWAEICNQNGIFPEYLVDHLSQEQKNMMLQKHKLFKDANCQNINNP